jgi:hypothetical protein
MVDLGAMANIKGTAVVDLVRWLRKHQATAGDKLPAPLRPYLHRRILLSGWYPAEDFLGLLHAFVAGNAHPRGFERAGIASARRDLTRIYATNLVPGDIAATASRMRALWNNYHDTGELIPNTEPGRTTIEIRGYAVRSAEMCRLNGAYYGEVIVMAGARLISTEKQRCTLKGDPSCIWEYKWTPTSDDAG